MRDKITNYIKSFFEWLEIEISSLEVVEREENFYFIKLNSIDSALLIGKDWDTIESIQSILRMCVNNFSDDKIKLKLEINEYCKTYEQRLFWKIDKNIISLKNNLWEYDLWELSSYDRKRIHSYVAKNYNEVLSKSRWKWENRRIFLSLKNSAEIKTKYIPRKLTIDIDGNSI